MIKIALTGGIGTGKTYLSRHFIQMGIPVFYADDEAKKLYSDPDFLDVMRAEFPDAGLWTPNGELDFAELKQSCSEKPFLDRLSALVHPFVMRQFNKWSEKQGVTAVIMESAIIYEYDLQRHLDVVVTVYLEKEERLRRLELRDKVSREVIEARMRNQLSAEEKMDRADYVILNYEGNPRNRQVATLDQWLKK